MKATVTIKLEGIPPLGKVPQALNKDMVFERSTDTAVDIERFERLGAASFASECPALFKSALLAFKELRDPAPPPQQAAPKPAAGPAKPQQRGGPPGRKKGPPPKQ